MQEQKMRDDELEEELNEVKAKLGVAEWERDRALDELKRRMNHTDVIVSSNNLEVNNMKESLLNAHRELKIKDKTIECLKSEVDKVKHLEFKLTEKDSSLHITEEELSNLKASMAQTKRLLSDNTKRVEELEAEVGRRKESEAKLFNSFVAQTSQLEQASILLEKSNLKVASFQEKIQELEEENRQKGKEMREEIERLQNELRKKGDESSCVERKNLLDEIRVLKNELKHAMEAEHNSKKAMDDLAFALKEVAMKSNQDKEKLKSLEEQLEAMKKEAEKSKKMVKCTKETYEALLDESKRENDRLKNTVDRLRLEADESLLAWNEKEIEFVKCIKKVEDEKKVLGEENFKLKESSREAKEISNNSKEEIRKLRDILKQALNEANVAKEAANLARVENSSLKDSLTEKDKALITLAQETERLRINEAEANESIKELKRLVPTGSKKETAKLEKEIKEQKKAAKKDTTIVENNDNNKEHKEMRRLSSTFNFDLNQLWPLIPGITTKSNVDEEPEKDDDVVGSIFDLVESPVAVEVEEPLPKPPLHHRRTSSSACIDDEKSLNLENFDEDEHFDDMEIDRSSQGKRKALLRRFGDLLKRKNSHSPKELPHPPKEVPHPQKEISA